MSHTYKFPRAALTVDAVVFAKESRVVSDIEARARRAEMKEAGEKPLAGHEDTWYVLTITRGKEPFEGRRALPGGFFDLDDESTQTAAERELREETGFEGELDWTLVGVFSRKDRDPRERVISHAYTAVLPERVPVKGQDDAATAEWIEVAALADPKQWAFDHYEILVSALGVHGYSSPGHI